MQIRLPLVKMASLAFRCFLVAPLLAVHALISAPPLYKRAGAPIPDRVSDLLSRMTLDEKIAQLLDIDGGFSAQQIQQSYGSTGIGSLQSKFYKNQATDPASVIAERNKLQSFFINTSRLNIPVSFTQEGLHSGCDYGTVFPMPSAFACSWDEALAYQIGASLGNQSRACGVDTTFSPVVNMWDDDRFGRYQEGFSPDPTITAHLGVAWMAGIQGGASGGADTYLPSFASNAIAVAKHFAAYGSALGGLNGGPPPIDNRTLFEQFLRPWRAMVAAGMRSAMPSHNTIFHVPVHGNVWMLQQVLRSEFGFGNGTLVSDCNDLSVLMQYGVSPNLTDATARGIRAGVDLDLVCGTAASIDTYMSHIPDAIAAGLIAETDVDVLVGHVLAAKFSSGLFDAPYTDPSWAARLDTPADRQLAYTAAVKSVVLLQNTDNFLPFNASGAGVKIAVIGPQAVCSIGAKVESSPADATSAWCYGRVNMLGTYTLDAGVVAVPLIPDALLTTFPQAKITVQAGCDIDSNRTDLIPAAVAAAAAADVVILALGDSMQSCGEWQDRDSLDLPGGQLALIDAITSRTTTPVVVVLIHGRAATFGPGNVLLSKVKAVLAAWRPGEMGAQAIVDIITGRAVPSGKLTNSWAQSVGQLGSGAQPWLARIRGKWIANGRSPADVDGRVYDPYVPSTIPGMPALGYRPLFVFGHGLSYTTFTYQSLTVSVPAGARDHPLMRHTDRLTVSGRGKAGYAAALATIAFTANVTLCNAGSVAGTEIVQLYVQDPVGASPMGVVRHWKRLVSFARVPLSPGACTSVQLPVSVDDLSLYDDDMRLALLPGNYTVRAGGCSNTDTLVQYVQF